MNKWIITAASMFLSTSVLADVGLGISVQNNDQRFSMPIDITESFRIEPMFGFSKEESKDTQYSDFEETREGYYVGAGFFGQAELVENLNFLYGARISYLTIENKGKSDFSDYETEADGYSFAPTIGFEYFLVEKLSIGGEFSVEYNKSDGESKEDLDTYDFSEESTNTDTSLSVRFYF